MNELLFFFCVNSPLSGSACEARQMKWAEVSMLKSTVMPTNTQSISMNRKLWSLSPPDSLVLKKIHYLIRTYCAKEANTAKSNRTRNNQNKSEGKAESRGFWIRSLSLKELSKSFRCSIVCIVLLLAKGQALLQSIKGRRKREPLSSVAGWDSNSDFLLNRNQTGRELGKATQKTGYRSALRPL